MLVAHIPPAAGLSIYSLLYHTRDEAYRVFGAILHIHPQFPTVGDLPVAFIYPTFPVFHEQRCLLSPIVRPITIPSLKTALWQTLSGRKASTNTIRT